MHALYEALNTMLAAHGVEEARYRLRLVDGGVGAVARDGWEGRIRVKRRMPTRWRAAPVPVATPPPVRGWPAAQRTAWR
jgi:hypothetical protein